MERDALRRFHLRPGVTMLARALRPDLQAVLQPHPDALAAEPGMTAFAVVQAGGEAVIITAVEPQHAAAHVTRRPGLRHLAESGRQDWRC